MNTLFSKQERNLSKKSIDQLYQSGNRVNGNYLTFIWKTQDNKKKLIQLLISVPQKKIKKAVNRNYIKRIIREAYRTNKSLIYELISEPIEIIILYNKSTLPEFNKLSTELVTLFNLIEKNK